MSAGPIHSNEIPLPDNQAPAALRDGYAVTGDGPLVVAAADGVLRNDVDIEMDPLTAVLVSGPAHGELALSPDGAFTYQPEAGYAGYDSFSYMAHDGVADSWPASVTLAVGEGFPVTPLSVGFEDLAGVVANPIEVGNIPDGYQGFDWDIAGDALNLTGFSLGDVQPGSGYAIGVSGNWAAALEARAPNAFLDIHRSDGGGFVWERAFVTSAVAPQQDVTIIGLNDGAIVGTLSLQATDQINTQVAPGWTDPLDHLLIVGAGGPLVFDNFDFLV